MNWLGLLVSFTYIALVIASAKVFERKGKEISRKFIHIMLGNWWIIAMLFFNNVWFAILGPAVFVVVNYLSYKKDLIKVMERDEQDGFGTVYYALSLLILAILSFGIYKNPSLGLVPTLVMAYGDGLAAIIGKRFKSKKYKLGDTKKSFAGSLTMFLISLVLIGGYLWFVNVNVFWTSAHWPLISIMMAFCVTAIEAVSGKGIDNISVPIITLLLLMLI